jgi:nicotinate-nucleotide adenylyltransferase
MTTPSHPRLGLYGGSFDPVHCGHLLVAQAACEELELARLFFIPAAQSPFKPQEKPAEPEDRLRLLRLALSGQPQYEIDEQEVKRGGRSFTIDTVHDYSRRFPEAQLFCLIGADHVATLPTWRSAEELAQSIEFVVIPRPGEPSAPLPQPFRGRELVGFPLGISSSQIRARIRAGRTIRGLVPNIVGEAIQESGLYI